MQSYHVKGCGGGGGYANMTQSCMYNLSMVAFGAGLLCNNSGGGGGGGIHCIYVLEHSSVCMQAGTRHKAVREHVISTLATFQVQVITYENLHLQATHALYTCAFV